jgi:hypothetical protein
MHGDVASTPLLPRLSLLTLILTFKLPCFTQMAALRIQRNTGLIPSLNIASPTFLEDTSAPIGSLGLYIKATVLLGRVVNFLQRLPRVKCADAGHPCLEVKEGVKASCVVSFSLSALPPSAPLLVFLPLSLFPVLSTDANNFYSLNRPEFIELDVALLKFKATHSANFFDASGNQIDGFLASTYAIPHVYVALSSPSQSRNSLTLPVSAVRQFFFMRRSATVSTSRLHRLSRAA